MKCKMEGRQLNGEEMVSFAIFLFLIESRLWQFAILMRLSLSRPFNTTKAIEETPPPQKPVENPIMKFANCYAFWAFQLYKEQSNGM